MELVQVHHISTGYFKTNKKTREICIKTNCIQECHSLTEIVNYFAKDLFERKFYKMKKIVHSLLELLLP